MTRIQHELTNLTLYTGTRIKQIDKSNHDSVRSTVLVIASKVFAKPFNITVRSIIALKFTHQIISCQKLKPSNSSELKLLRKIIFKFKSMELEEKRKFIPTSPNEIIRVAFEILSFLTIPS